MASSIGTTVKTTLFGQSHSAAIGCVIEGLPSGFTIDDEALATFMARRTPANSLGSTPRSEADVVHILSGLNEAHATCGAPLALMIENTNTRSQDYEAFKSIPRPGHADYSAWKKYHGAQDARGGGHFSGRLTAPLTAAGAIAAQILAKKDIRICAHIKELSGITDEAFFADDEAQLASQFDALTSKQGLPVLSSSSQTAIEQAIKDARENKDSLGGIIEVAAIGMDAGFGEPIFDGIDSLLARAFFGIPAVKAVEIGAGIDAARLSGSKNNDPYTISQDRVVPLSNNAGGVLGGITTGAPIVARLAIKPIPSIGIEQDSVNLETLTPEKLTIQGRHDVTACIRAVPVVEATLALVLLDVLMTWPPHNKS